MKPVTGICLYQDTIVLKQINLVRSGYSLNPDVQCKICLSTGEGSSEPWSDGLKGCFVLYWTIHKETCKQ